MNTTTIKIQNLNINVTANVNTKEKKTKSCLLQLRQEPYRIFFPIGWLGALLGALVWVLYYFQAIEYPAQLHKIGMIHLFLLSYILGFLLTAIPRFTATTHAKLSELISGLIGISLIGLSLFLREKSDFVLWFGSFISLSTLLCFLISRFKNKIQNPPSSFVFIGAALIFSWALILLQLTNILIFKNSFIPYWKVFLNSWIYFNFIISLIIGVGSKLIPAITGWTQIQSVEDQSKSQKRFIIYALFFYLIFLLSHLSNAFNVHLIIFNNIIFGALKASLLSIIAIKEWNLLKKPASKTYVSWGLWLSAWSIIVGEWLSVFLYNWKIHIEHMTLISGFLLITFIVGTRVGIAHGGYDLEIEKKSKRILFLIGFVFLSAITRISAGFLGERYSSHIFYAAITLIIGLFVWGSLMLPKFKTSKGSNQC